MSRELFATLFAWLDERLGQCDDTLSLTRCFLEERKMDVTAVVSWLESHGGYCDCEVFANVEQLFE